MSVYIKNKVSKSYYLRYWTLNKVSQVQEYTNKKELTKTINGLLNGKPLVVKHDYSPNKKLIEVRPVRFLIERQIIGDFLSNKSNVKT